MNRSWPQQKANQVRGSAFLRHVSAGAAFEMLSQGSMRGSVLAAFRGSYYHQAFACEPLLSAASKSIFRFVK